MLRSCKCAPRWSDLLSTDDESPYMCQLTMRFYLYYFYAYKNTYIHVHEQYTPIYLSLLSGSAPVKVRLVNLICWPPRAERRNEKNSPASCCWSLYVCMYVCMCVCMYRRYIMRIHSHTNIHPGSSRTSQPRCFLHNNRIYIHITHKLTFTYIYIYSRGSHILPSIFSIQ